MGIGIKRLDRLQFGKEVTPGTAVVATTRWRGAGNMLDDQRKIEEIDEFIGILGGGADRDAVVQLLGMVDLADVPATTEQFQYLLAMGLGGPTTGAADGAGTDKIYTTNIPTTTVPTLVPYSVEGGDNSEVEVMEYTVCKKITLKGAMGQTARMSGSLMGRQVTRLGASFTAATIPAVSELPVQKGKVYLDAVGGVYGATQLTGVIVGFEVNVEISINPIFTMDGNLYYAQPLYVDHKITGSLTFLHDTAAQGASGAKLDFRNRTVKKLRLDLIGDAPASGGTTYQNKRIICDLPCKYLNPGPLADQSGNNVLNFKFHSRYNTTVGDAGKFVVVNELATLP
jgi:hypothetical protein